MHDCTPGRNRIDVSPLIADVPLALRGPNSGRRVIGDRAARMVA